MPPTLSQDLRDKAQKIIEQLEVHLYDFIDGSEEASIAAKALAQELLQLFSTESLPTLITATQQLFDLIDEQQLDLRQIQLVDSTLQQLRSYLNASVQTKQTAEVQPTDSPPLTSDALELLDDFLLESEDLLNRYTDALLDVEANPKDSEAINQAFRSIHTIKGNAGFVKVTVVETLGHLSEEILSKIRSGEQHLTERHISTLLQVADILFQCFQHLQQKRSQPTLDVSGITTQLEHLLSQSQASKERHSGTPTIEIFRPKSSSPDASLIDDFVIEAEEHLALFRKASRNLEEDIEVQRNLANAFRAIHNIRTASAVLQFPTLEALSTAGEKLISSLLNSQGALRTDKIVSLLSLGDGVSSILHNLRTNQTEAGEHPEEIQHRLKQLKNNIVTQSTTKEFASNKPTIRVRTDVLDNLVNLVGELVLTQNQVLPHYKNTAAHVKMKEVIAELQQNIIQTRLQPIGLAFRKVPRLVREVGIQTQKQVDVEIVGGDTELDKRILEEIQDPLLHLIRNAIDHGIEHPTTRISEGKSATGNIIVKAQSIKGRVQIEISDDGIGIDGQKIMQKAVELGLITQEEGEKLSEKQKQELIFVPGFSTSNTVTKISGRGVGMDVIKAGIDRIGGIIDVQSSLAKGTTFILNIPLTIAIIPGLIVRCGQTKFVIPTASVQYLIKIEKHNQPFVRNDKYMFPYKGELLPCAYLNAFLKISSNRSGIIVLCLVKGYRFGLIVDQAIDIQQIVIKPLHHHLKNLPYSSSVTILGDGRPSLILDVPSIGEHLHLLYHKSKLQLPEVQDSESYILLRTTTAKAFYLPIHHLITIKKIPPEEISGHSIPFAQTTIPLLHIEQRNTEDTTGRLNWGTTVAICRVKGKRIAFTSPKPIDIIRTESLDNFQYFGKPLELFNLETVAESI